MFEGLFYIVGTDIDVEFADIKAYWYGLIMRSRIKSADSSLFNDELSRRVLGGDVPFIESLKNIYFCEFKKKLTRIYKNLL